LDRFLGDRSDASKTKPAAKKTQKIASGARRSPRQPRVAKPKNQESGGFGSLIRGLILGPAGYCIRCGNDLSEAEVDAGKTMCAKDYASWARFKKPDFKENTAPTAVRKSPPRLQNLNVRIATTTDDLQLVTFISGRYHLRFRQ